MTRPLTKHTIVIWTEPEDATADLEDLAYAAVRGDGYCALHTREAVADPLADENAPSADFFRLEEEEEDDA